MFVGCAGVLILAAGFLTEVPPAVRAKLAPTGEVAGAFVQTKTVLGTPAPRVYRTTGTYRVRPGVDFAWRTLTPFETLFAATQTDYVYSNEDECVTRKLSDLPGFSKFEGVSRGDFAAVFKAFDALYKEENGRFFILAKPKVSELKRVLTRVDAEGDATNLVVSAEFPDKTVIKVEMNDFSNLAIDGVRKE